MRVSRLFWSAYLAWHLRGQARYAFSSPAAVRRDQERRVRRQVAYAYRHVPYYRETLDRLGLGPSEFRCAEELARLPILERSQLQSDPERFVSDAQPIGRYLELRTGGSTSAPVGVFHDTATLFQTAAHTERERALVTREIGRRFGYREAMIVSPDCSAADARAACYRRGWFPAPVRMDRRQLLVTDPPDANLAACNAFQPDLLYSYGSYLDLLFAYIESTGAAFHRPKAICYTSDLLPDPARRLILEKHRIPLFSWYRAVEASNLGFECERHTGIHLNIDLYPLRIVDADGRPLAPGEAGDVVVSNLVNRATVLLNYRLGDIAAIQPGACPCGRSLPLLSFPHGRSDDYLRLPSGRLLHAQAVHACFSYGEPVLRYQLLQDTPGRVTVAAVPAPGADLGALGARIEAKLGRAIGEGVRIDVRFVDSIRPSSTGKHRTVVSTCGPARGAAAAVREGAP